MVLEHTYIYIWQVDLKRTFIIFQSTHIYEAKHGFSWPSHFEPQGIGIPRVGFSMFPFRQKTEAGIQASSSLKLAWMLKHRIPPYLF